MHVYSTINAAALKKLYEDNPDCEREIDTIVVAAEEYLDNFSFGYDEQEKVYNISQKSYFLFMDMISLMKIYYEHNLHYTWMRLCVTRQDIKFYRENIISSANVPIAYGIIGELLISIAQKTSILKENVAMLNYYSNVIEFKPEYFKELIKLCGDIIICYENSLERRRH